MNRTYWADTAVKYAEDIQAAHHQFPDVSIFGLAMSLLNKIAEEAHSGQTSERKEA